MVCTSNIQRCCLCTCCSKSELRSSTAISGLWKKNSKWECHAGSPACLPPILCQVCIFCSRFHLSGFRVCVVPNPPQMLSRTVCNRQSSQGTLSATWCHMQQVTAATRLVWFDKTRQRPDERAARGHTCRMQQKRQPCLIRPARLRSCASEQQI